MASHQQLSVMGQHTAVVVPAPSAGQISATTQNNKIAYSEKNVNSVKWLIRFQLFLAAVIICFQVITVALDDNFRHEKAQLEGQERFRYFFFYDSPTDHAGTGLWVGLTILISAIVGLFGVKEPRKALIVTPLILNIFGFIFTIPLIVLTSVTVGKITRCRHFGEEFYYYEYYDDYWNNNTTTDLPSTTEDEFYTFPPEEFFGETLEGAEGAFYCKAVYFKVWITLDIVILICAVMEFILTMTIFVYNCIAVCSPCCHRSYNNEAVVYYSHTLPAVVYNPTPPQAAQTMPASYPTTNTINPGGGAMSEPASTHYPNLHTSDEKQTELPPPAYS